MRGFFCSILIAGYLAWGISLIVEPSRRTDGLPTSYKNSKLSIGVMEDEDVVSVRGATALRIAGRYGTGTIHLPRPVRLTFRAKEGRPAKFRYHLVKETLPGSADIPFFSILTDWIPVGVKTGFLDNREYFVVTHTVHGETFARQLRDKLSDRGEKRWILEERVRIPRGSIEVLGDAGERIARVVNGKITVFGDKLVVENVLFGKGYSWEGREDREYSGQIILSVSNSGTLLVVNKVPMEEYIKGVLPSEIYPSSPVEALKAQAVAARSEVLAKWKKRHLSEDFDLCDDQHCQVYSGVHRRLPETDEAVVATTGEILIDLQNSVVLDAVYSSNCGGYSVANEEIWISSPNPALRSRWDSGRGRSYDLQSEQGLTEFLKDTDFFCLTDQSAGKKHFRWRKDVSLEEMTTVLREYYPQVREVKDIERVVRTRSGRIIEMDLLTDQGIRKVRREFRVRRVMGSARSALFVYEKTDTGYVIRGAGWGHGVGMCQDGAIGRALAGQSYREILGHYFHSARLDQLQ